MNWEQIFKEEKQKEYFQLLEMKIAEDRKVNTVYPPEADVYTAFDYTAFEDVKVVILGQDPYHQPGQAMGMSFSVHQSQKLPKSLINIYKELEADLGVHNTHGDLTAWAKQGVLLLNTLLTVREGEPMSHANYGWEQFTDRIITELGKRNEPIIFVLWGKKAQMKKSLIQNHHDFIESSHPSPLGAYRGFMGSRPFSQINDLLKHRNDEMINWSVTCLDK
ncbi:uracil-DNA glycosylase [Erysipelothrix tonsillarum]|uniref:uracil-DNA glycosylase n=1 Tax=Erysipelothrix tonsillarum TaxID=38402 RepID=UPI00035D18B1|nr:uracil-DNA glycosylase [Erysipelothrix tonsillarum]